MHPYVWTTIAEQRGAELRAEAARHRRLREAVAGRSRPAGSAGGRLRLPSRHGWFRAHPRGA